MDNQNNDFFQSEVSMTAIINFAGQYAVTDDKTGQVNRGVSVEYFPFKGSDLRQGNKSIGARCSKFSTDFNSITQFPSQGIYRLVGTLDGGKFRVSSATLLLAIDSAFLAKLTQKTEQKAA